MRLRRIVSGGQTGVDQAALYAARACGFEISGFVPPGFASETSEGIPSDLRDALTPLSSDELETLSASNAELRDELGSERFARLARTRRNVEVADATLVVIPHELQSPGTAETIAHARRLGRALLVLCFDPRAATDAGLQRGVCSEQLADASSSGRVEELRRWVREHDPATLNVAGPCESEAPGFGRCVTGLIQELAKLGKPSDGAAGGTRTHTPEGT